MSNYRLQIQPDKTIKVLELNHKPTGMVLNPSLSSFILMKYPRLATGKIVPLTASQLYLAINQWSELWNVIAVIKYTQLELSTGTARALNAVRLLALLAYQLLTTRQAILSSWSIRVLLKQFIKPVGAKGMVHALGEGSMLEGVTVVPL